MAQTKNKISFGRPRKVSPIGTYLKEYCNMDFVRELVYNPKKLYITCWALMAFEVLLNVFIVHRVRYTEIDWIAYMQEVEGFLNGTLDYAELRGDTGPLVYPAGFVYLYSVLYYLTSYGENVRLAQYIFLALYLCQMYVTFEIYCKTQKIPPYALVLSTLTSYRIHSIYVLRLFNDPFAVFFFYVSLSLFLKDKWVWGSAFYSLAVSVKMNILLYAPCLLAAYLTNLSYFETVLNLSVCAVVQLLLGLPFLYGNFWGYVKGSFDLGRVFEHRWTVNYRFLDRELFENKTFHLGLLMVHVSLLILFYPAVKKYLTSYRTLRTTVEELKRQKNRAGKGKAKVPALGNDEQRQLVHSSDRQRAGGRVGKQRRAKETVEVDFSTVTRLFVLPFYVTNLIGIACARSLHYQFYSWYFHSLLYLVHSTPYRKPVIFLLLAVIEFCWNTYPSTGLSSGLLHVCHFTVLYGVYKVMNQK